MFEEKTYENLLQDVLNNAPEDIDTRPGSIFYDSISGIIIKIAEFYTDLKLIFELSRPDTAEDEYLDALASQFGVKRQSATKAQYFTKFNDTIPDDGERFFHDGLYFVLKKTGDNIPYFEAEEPGTEYNRILTFILQLQINNCIFLKLYGTKKILPNQNRFDRIKYHIILAAIVNSAKNAEQINFISALLYDMQ